MSWRDIVNNQNEEKQSGWRELVKENHENLRGVNRVKSAAQSVSSSKGTNGPNLNDWVVNSIEKAKEPAIKTTRKTGNVTHKSEQYYDNEIAKLKRDEKNLETKINSLSYQNITDKKLSNQLTDIKSQISKLENEKYLSKDYSYVPLKADYTELSKPKKLSAFDTDSRYKSVNNTGNWQDFMEQSDMSTSEKNYKYMTDEERGIFNYLYNTQGEKKANDYLDRLEYELNDRGMEQFVLDYQEYAHEHPIAGTIGSTFTEYLGGAVGTADVIGQNIANVGRRIMGKETVPIDYNTPAQQGTVMTNTIRSTVAGDLNNNHGTLNENIPIVGGLGLGDLYLLGTSMIDSAAAALTAGAGGSALLGSAAASSAMQEAAERGLSDSQILKTGIASGAAEMLFEKLSIDNLLSPKDGAAIGQAVKNVLKQGGVEASEEALTTVANTITDNIINGNKSEFNRSVEEYKQAGMTEIEAKKQSMKDWLNSAFLDALGGFISGGVMGGGYEAGTRLSYNSKGKSIVADDAAVKLLRESANENGISLAENPTYKEAGRVLRSIDFNRAMGNTPQNTKDIQTEQSTEKTPEKSSSKSMLRATYDTGDKYTDEYITGVKDGKIQFGNGTSHSLADVYINDPETASVVRYALENENIGNTIITAYNSGVIDGVSQNATDFIAQFENAAEYGKVGAKLDYVKNSEAVNTLTPTQIEMAYYIGSGQSTSAVSENYVKAENKTQELKVDSQKQSQANRLSKAVGRDIVFYESGNISENGFYNPKDGKIYVNSNSKNPLPQIVSHELTHSIELSKSYGELSRIIFNKLRKTGADIEQMRQQKKDLYSRNGIELQDETAIDQEIVAEYIEKNLLTDEKSINEFVRENRSLGEKIFSWINSVLAKLGNKNAQEREFLIKARDLYLKALEETSIETAIEVKEKFSISEPIEETENLIALHNLTEDKLEKSIVLGGFPMPSIAITKADIPHTNFGDITLVMSKSTIDPKANKKNVVYSADAWTPVFPQIEYEADRKVQSKISKKFYELANKLGHDAVRPMYNYVNDMERELQVNNGEKGIIDKLKEDTSMMNLYLADVGKEQVQPIYKEVVTKLKDSEVELYEYLIKGLGKDTLLDLTPKNGESPITRRRVWLEEHEEALKTVYGDYLKKTGIPEETVNEMMSNDKIAKSLMRGAVYARNYLKNGAEKRSSEYDGEATKTAIRKAVDKGAYEEWLNKLFKGIEKSTGVYNNKDLYTPSGNRRTFKQTHYPVTLENIVKSMAGQNNGDTKNVSGFYGIKSLRAGTVERFKSIAAMHEREGRLQHLSEEQAAAINDSLSNRLDDIINKILQTKSHSQYDNNFIMMDSVGNILVEVGDSGKYTVDNIEKIFSKYGYKINNGLAAEIRDLLFDTSQMPVNIFEAKPERAVGFDEVLAAVVPNDTKEDLINSLKDAGVKNVLTYEKDNNSSRVQAVNSVEGAKFSISESYSDEIDEWNRNGRKDNEKFILGTTSDIIQGLGARENDIYIKSEKINTIFDEHPEMTIEEIKKIPEILEYPVMILKSKNKNRGQKNNTRIVVLGKVTAKNGLPVIGVLDLRPFENGSVVDDMQKINSTYTKKNTLNFLEDSEVLYADKKRTASLLKSVGLQLRPTELQRVGSIGSISYNKRSVNIVGVPFNDLFIRDSENQYSVSDDEIRNLNTQEEKLTTELSEMERQYLIAQIEQGKRDAKLLRSERKEFKKRMDSLESKNAKNAKAQMRKHQRELDKKVDQITYLEEKLKRVEQEKDNDIIAARIAEGRIWSEKYNRNTKELEERIAKKNDELRAVRKRRDEQLEAKTESFKRYKGERRKTVLRGQIKSLVNDFNARLDRPNQKRYIPKELVSAVIDLTSVINVSNASNSPKIQAQMEHMKAVYDRYKNDPEYTVYDDFVSQMIGQVTKEIGNTPLRDMTENQLRMVYDTLTAFSRAVTDAQRFAAFEYDKSIYQAGTDAINEIRNSKLKFKSDGINNFVNWLLTPERFFNRLGGYRKNGIWEKVGKSLNESTQKAIGISREFYYAFREFSESNYADDLADQKKLYDVGLKTEDGNPIKITKGQMISIYMHLTSADNRRAIQYGGLSIPDMDAYYKGKAKNAFGKNKIRTVGLSQEMRTLRADYVSAQEELQSLFTKYTEDGEIKYNSINEIDMQMIEQYQKNIEAIETQMETASKNSDNYIAGIEENINKFLTDEDKKFIKTLRSWYKYSADKINEVTMRMYGIKRATVDNYYTIHRDPDLLAKEFSDIVMDFSLESWGSLKERVPSVQPILLTDVMFDVSSHANELSQYYGYVEMMRDFNKLYNTRSGNTSVKESVSQKLGAGSTKIAGVTGEQYIANLMADIVGSRTRQNSLFSILRRNVTRSALTVNIRVGFSQLSGTLSAPAEVGWSATLKGMGKGAVKALSPKYKEHLAAINEFYYERYKGEGGMREFSDIKIADNALDRIWNKIDDKTKGHLLNWSRSVDAYSTAVMYSMAEAYVQDTLQIKQGDAAYLDEVNKKFTSILIHTQPQGAATQRADLFRDPREGYSFVTLFKSQSNQFFNLLYDASARVWTYQNAIKNGDSTVTQEDLYMAKRDLANAATTVILGGSLGYAVTRFIANAILRHMNDYRDEDDEVTAQSIALGIANDSISSFAGILPLGEEIYDLIMASITDRPYYGISEAGLQSLNDTFNGIVSFSGDVKDNEVTLESFTKLIKAAAPMLMIPYNSINTIIEAAKGYINDIPSGNFLTFEYGAERNNATQGKRMYEAIIEGDTEKYNSVRDEMIGDNIAKGKSKEDAESSAKSALKSTLKDKFLEGDITSSDANEILVSYIYNGEETAVDDAYWTLHEWQSGNPEYSKYGDLKEAVIKADGAEFKQAKAELIEHGVKESSIRSEITKVIKDAYLNGELSLNEAKNKLILYNGLSASEAFEKIKEWKKEAK